MCESCYTVCQPTTAENVNPRHMETSSLPFATSLKCAACKPGYMHTKPNALIMPPMHKLPIVMR